MTTTTTGTDLATIEKTALDALNKSAKRSGLDDFLASGRRSLLLVDTSSSMERSIRAGGRRIDALRRTVTALREQHPAPVVMFGARVEVINEIPEPSGMTPLAAGILFALAQGATHLVVVTDGEPDSEGAALDAAREFGNPIDVFYIGDGNDQGARFAQHLARMTGGTCSLNDLSDTKQLAGKIVALLGDGN